MSSSEGVLKPLLPSRLKLGWMKLEPTRPMKPAASTERLRWATVLLPIDDRLIPGALRMSSCPVEIDMLAMGPWLTDALPLKALHLSAGTCFRKAQGPSKGEI